MYNQYVNANPTEAIQRNRLSVKGFLGTSNVLTIAILYTITTVLSFISSLLTSSSTTEALNKALWELGIDADIPSGMSISIPIIPILTIIAFFLLYSAGKNKNPHTPNSAGATMLMVIAIIQLVVFCLALLALIIGIIIAIAFAASASSNTRYYSYSYGFINSYVDASEAEATLAVVAIIAIIIALAIFALFFVYLIGMIRFSSSLKKGLTSPELTAKGAKAVGVSYVFFSIFSGISMLSSVASSGCSICYASQYSYHINGEFIISLIIAMVSSVLTFVLNINISKFAFSFNRHVVAESNNSNYSAPAQSPATQGYPYYNNFTTQNTAPTIQPEPEYIDISDNLDVSTPSSSAPVVKETPVAPVATQSVCPICGTETIPNQAFCAECGYKLN